MNTEETPAAPRSFDFADKEAQRYAGKAQRAGKGGWKQRPQNKELKFRTVLIWEGNRAGSKLLLHKKHRLHK